MQLRFKDQPFQTEAVEAVVDCFDGQPNNPGISYRMDPGKQDLDLEYTGFRNASVQLTGGRLLENIRTVQRRQNLSLSDQLAKSAGCQINLDVEMETGTGKR